jgi:hypothetical protein
VVRGPYRLVNLVAMAPGDPGPIERRREVALRHLRHDWPPNNTLPSDPRSRLSRARQVMKTGEWRP